VQGAPFRTRGEFEDHLGKRVAVSPRRASKSDTPLICGKKLSQNSASRMSRPDELFGESVVRLSAPVVTGRAA
jgi:hypothetical protein